MKEEHTNNIAKISVIDAVMGSGKTTATYRLIKDKLCFDYEQIMVISPNLSEVGGDSPDLLEPHVGRIRKELSELGFMNPTQKGKGKLGDTRELIERNENIASTHQNYKSLIKQDAELISINNNVLVIDEVLQPYEEYNDISQSSLKILFKSECIYIDDNNLLRWNHTDFPSTIKDRQYEHRDLIKLCDSERLHINSGSKGYILIKELPIEVLMAFDEIVILTYMFESSAMCAWLKSHGLPYKYLNVDFDKTEQELIDSFNPLINNFELPTSSKIIDKYNLSQSWWGNASSDKIDKITKACETFINKTGYKGVAQKTLLTCPKNKENAVKGKGFTRSKWLASSTRATNEYGDKTHIMYLLNKYPSPIIVNHLKRQGVELDQDQYALSEMIQFLWRGCIRNGEPMHVYIASSRMRGLFNKWLDGEFNSKIKTSPIIDTIYEQAA